MTKDPWPNGMGFDLVNEDGFLIGEVLSYPEMDNIQVKTLDTKGYGKKWVKLDREFELLGRMGTLHPEEMSATSLAVLAETYGEDLS